MTTRKDPYDIMVAQTHLMDCVVLPSQFTNPALRPAFKAKVTATLEKQFPGLKHLTDLDIDGSLVLLYSGPRSSLITVRCYVEGLVAVNIDYYKNKGERSLLSYETTRKLEVAMREATSAIRSHAVHAPIRRGYEYQRYYVIEDKRLLEYDIDELVFASQSPYQKVEIVHSKQLGNMLVLDNLQNLAESDIKYTETLMQRGKENFAGKEIVILGGGDGALLYELLKEKPKHVYMLELDDTVMKACAKHMRSVCGDVLDTMKTDKYEIILGDCFKMLTKFSAEGRKFDYIFGDLTDIPIATSGEGDEWDFVKHVIMTSMKLLRPTGKYMTHGNGVSFIESLQLFEEVLNKLPIPIKFTKDQAYVPSFFQEWVFYQLSHK